MRPQFVADAEGAASIVPEAVLFPLLAVSVQVPVSSVTPVTRPAAYTPSLDAPKLTTVTATVVNVVLTPEAPLDVVADGDTALEGEWDAAAGVVEECTVEESAVTAVELALTGFARAHEATRSRVNAAVTRTGMADAPARRRTRSV